MAIITNWATFYHDINLLADAQTDKSSSAKPMLHLPILESDGMITFVWNNAVVFRPRAGELGMLMISRRFDSDMLIHAKLTQSALKPAERLSESPRSVKKP